MMVIYPYKLYGDTYYINGDDNEDYPGFDIWVFDDPETGLHQEALLSGTDVAIDFIVKHHKINNPDQGFKLTFSNEPFEDYQLIGYWKEEGYSNAFFITDIGNWYTWRLPNSQQPNIDGWLCPALLKYFPTVPTHLYIRVDDK